MADPHRARAIIIIRSKWLNGTVLHYWFFGAGSQFSVPKVQANAVRDAFRKWKAVGIGLDFQEVNQPSEAEVRIGYSEADGVSQSAVGREVLNVPLNEPTTVYGWDLTDAYGSGTALHELGHALGLPHTNAFDDIMYSFRRPDDGERYFGAYRRRLRSDDDIGAELASGLSAADVSALQTLYRR